MFPTHPTPNCLLIEAIIQHFKGEVFHSILSDKEAKKLDMLDRRSSQLH